MDYTTESVTFWYYRVAQLMWSQLILFLVTFGCIG